ncbi:MAG: preprotein translocase subunit YajC [candidate division Zixibacteria bacterium]|nr:preprotein translocase subunit YajC [Candidatus Tariuqbacter arcticus]
MLLHFLAMTTPQGEGGAQGGGGIMTFLPWIAIILIFYFLLIRPQAKRQKQHQQMLRQLRKGDKIVTSGGVHGVIVGIKENSNVLTVKIADKVRVEVERSSITRVILGDSEDDAKKSDLS